MGQDFLDIQYTYLNTCIMLGWKMLDTESRGKRNLDQNLNIVVFWSDPALEKTRILVRFSLRVFDPDLIGSGSGIGKSSDPGPISYRVFDPYILMGSGILIGSGSGIKKNWILDRFFFWVFDPDSFRAPGTGSIRPVSLFPYLKYKKYTFIIFTVKQEQAVDKSVFLYLKKKDQLKITYKHMYNQKTPLA